MSKLERPSFGADAITLRDYFEARLHDLDLRLTERFQTQEKGITTALMSAEKAVNAALASSDRAVEKAEQAQALRNIVSNEFRNTLADQAATFWPIKEGQAVIANLSSRFDQTLDASRRELLAQLDGHDARIGAVERQQSVSQGRLSAVSVVWAVSAVVLSVGINLVLRLAGH